jgi:DNA-binding beta-propeller fold protein YncE
LGFKDYCAVPIPIVEALLIGNNPLGVAFDGTNIWVTSKTSGTVTKLLASTGALVGTYTVGNNPIGVAFDGTDIWVANSRGSDQVTSIPVS